ncbi:MAG: porin family protein [Gammaproteobacteria bacterium]|nr:porin family protein [Gammaproteobacteria bacterium]MDH5630106.1 porin family protein [Gammaproteobacteria bacterium]
MKSYLKVLILIVLAPVNFVIAENNKPHSFGMSITSGNYDQSSGNGNVTVNTFEYQYDFSDNWSVEARLGKGTSKTVISGGFSETIEISSIKGLYFIRHYDKNEEFHWYTLIGGTTIEEKTFFYTSNESRMALGFGVENKVEDNVNIKFGYTQYMLTNRGTNYGGLEIGVKYRF